MIYGWTIQYIICIKKIHFINSSITTIKPSKKNTILLLYTDKIAYKNHYVWIAFEA